MNFLTLNLRRWFVMVFALACLIINVVVYLLYEKNQQILASKTWVVHTYNVIISTEQLFSSLQDMQTAQRGYLLTGSESFLVPYRVAKSALDSQLQQLMNLTKNHSQRYQQLRELTNALYRQRQLLERQIQLKERTGSFSLADMDDSKVIMDEIKSLNNTILRDEWALLDQRHREENERQKNYVRTIFATAGLSIIGLLAANGAIFLLSIRRQSAEDDLRRINKEMEGFTYIASHDLRSPLVNLKGFSEEMRYAFEELQSITHPVLEGLPEKDLKRAHQIMEEDIPDALHYIHSSVEKMDKLTNAILELSRIGKRELKLETVDIKKVVQHSLDTLQHQISSQNISVTIHALPSVVADALSVEQVFSNVLDNAIKYLDPSRPGKIEIGGYRNYRETTYWIRDNGRGILAHDMEKIFEIYRRGGNNKDIPGDGMGMAYVRTTLRRLGGMIWCESTPGKGSTFYFKISNTLKKDEMP